MCKCEHCNKEIRHGDTICVHCGEKIEHRTLRPMVYMVIGSWLIICWILSFFV